MSEQSQITETVPARRSMEAFGLAARRPASLATIIGRIEQAIDEETAGLRGNPDFDLKASNARKSRCLYELNRAIKGADLAEMASGHRESLTRLRQKLARNEAAILAHLNAVGEVAALLRDVIQTAEADGTYSAGEFGWAQA
jgi:hypothetical protein